MVVAYNLFIEKTKQWIQDFVIGQHLCPFAAVPFRQDRIRYRLQASPDMTHLADAVIIEATNLKDNEDIDTSFIIHPDLLLDFDDYLDFVDYIQTVMQEMDLTGVIQLATFHPDYQFEGTQMNDPENYTNRSPYPMIHLLKEESVTHAVDHYADVEAIPQRNIDRMNELGLQGIKKILKQIDEGPEAKAE